jgi:transposase InsO family protein
MRMLASLRKFSADEIAQERLKMIRFYDEHGEAQSQKYFGVNRKTIHVWKKKLASAGQHLDALMVRSTRPKQVRRTTTDPQVLAFIRQLREDHPRLGKEKIKPLLDQHCHKLRITSPAISTIGKIIKRHKLFFQKNSRIYHNPNTKWAQNSGKPRLPRIRVRYAQHPPDGGHWQLDTMMRQLDQLKVYFYSAIDVKAKLALSLPYSHLNSHNARDFFEKLLSFCPMPIQDVQTDNGQEFEGEFDAFLRSQSIPHHWSYPRCPRIDGCVERYQRTLFEEFLQSHEDSVRYPREFLHQLSEYLLFYNTQRIHSALGKQIPLDFLLSNNLLSKMSVTYTAGELVQIHMRQKA